MWFGKHPDVPHGIFRISDYPELRYSSIYTTDSPPRGKLVFDILTSDLFKPKV